MWIFAVLQIFVYPFLIIVIIRMLAYLLVKQITVFMLLNSAFFFKLLTSANNRVLIILNHTFITERTGWAKIVWPYVSPRVSHVPVVLVHIWSLMKNNFVTKGAKVNCWKLNQIHRTTAKECFRSSKWQKLINPSVKPNPIFDFSYSNVKKIVPPLLSEKCYQTDSKRRYFWVCVSKQFETVFSPGNLAA